MVKFLLWCILLVFCWPLALLALVLYPLVWLLLLPFRIVGIAVDGVLELVGSDHPAAGAAASRGLAGSRSATLLWPISYLWHVSSGRALGHSVAHLSTSLLAMH